MTDFGGKLRQAREGRGISLRQIAASTKISVAALEALERNDISKLPGGIFSRSFVRSYAAEVGLDPEETVNEFLERFQGEPPPERGPVVQVPEEEIAFERHKQLMARVFLFVVAVMLLAAAVLVYVLLRNRPGAESPAEGAGARMVTPAAPPASGTSAGQPAAQEPAAAAPVSSAPPPATRGPMRLELHPTGPCWVSVEADGKVVLERMMQPGERETLTVRDGMAITVGDAAAFAFTIDGREGRALGGAGEVKTARITRATLAEFVR
jgi:cytoskeletal protein RodZ